MPLTESALRKVVKCNSEEATCLQIKFQDLEYAAYLVAASRDGFLLAVPDDLDTEEVINEFSFVSAATPALVEESGIAWSFQFLECGVEIIKLLSKVRTKENFKGVGFESEEGGVIWRNPVLIYERAKLMREENAEIEVFFSAEEQVVEPPRPARPASTRGVGGRGGGLASNRRAGEVPRCAADQVQDGAGCH